MKSNLPAIAILMTAILFLSSNIKAQHIDEIKKQKLAERKQKVKTARERAAQETFTIGYHGGTMAPIGISYYTMNPDKLGFYISGRGGSEKDTPYKGLNLNIGITKNLFYPVGMYLAAGYGDYTERKREGSSIGYGYKQGIDTSAGLIFHVSAFELQGGVSLFNMGKPEVCFGIGFNFLR